MLAEAESSGNRVVRLTVTRAAASIPFGAAAPLLAPLPATVPSTGTAAGATGSANGARPASGGKPAGTVADPAEEGTLLAAHRAFAAWAGDDTIVVGVDDAHLLDQATAMLLGMLADGGHVRLVLTLRTGDPVPPPVRDLARRPGARRLALAELPEPEVRELLGRVLDGEVESASLARLWDATRGNPLFLRELARDALESGALARRHGVWAWAPAPFAGPRLHDLVAARVGALAGAEREVAGLLALGEPLPVGRLAWLAGPEVVDGMCDQGLVTVERVEGRRLARLAHPLYADGIRAQLGPLETADIYATLVRAALAEAGTHIAGPPDPASLDPDERLRLAVWSISSSVEADPALLAAAAADARDHDQPTLAERLARAALGQSPSTGIARPPAPVPPPCPVSFAAALTLGEALVDLERPDEAEAVLAPLVDIARDDLGRARVAGARLAALRVVEADGAARARALAADAIATIDDPMAPRPGARRAGRQPQPPRRPRRGRPARVRADRHRGRPRPPPGRGGRHHLAHARRPAGGGGRRRGPGRPRRVVRRRVVRRHHASRRRHGTRPRPGPGRPAALGSAARPRPPSSGWWPAGGWPTPRPPSRWPSTTRSAAATSTPAPSPCCGAASRCRGAARPRPGWRSARRR